MKNWIKELKADGPKDLLLAVIGNKTDLIDNEMVPYD
jgi:GTPase SAR1 family protein